MKKILAIILIILSFSFMSAYIYKYIEYFDYEVPVDDNINDIQENLYDNNNNYNDDYYYDDDVDTSNHRIYVYGDSFKTGYLKLYEDYYIYGTSSLGDADFVIKSTGTDFHGSIYTFGKKGTFDYSLVYYDDNYNVIGLYEDTVDINNTYKNFDLYGIDNNRSFEYKYFKFFVKDLVLYNEG